MTYHLHAMRWHPLHQNTVRYLKVVDSRSGIAAAGPLFVEPVAFAGRHLDRQPRRGRERDNVGYDRVRVKTT